jgi:tRNA modification GTPase
MDTIFALATGASRAAVAVLRISGPGCGAAVTALAGTLPPSRRMALRRLRGAAGETIDRALVLWTPGPASYTGEDAAELHLHGGVAVTEAASLALVALGLRPAERGEFTKRAFLNGKLGLTEAEAVADLIEAETAAQRRQALRQLDGALETQYQNWTALLLVLLAQQEALIDFPDEDLPPDEEAALLGGIRALAAGIEAHLQDGGRGEKLRRGLVFAITGKPNAGKSSLVNALAGREVAIVAASPGTTRDVVEARAIFGEVPVTLADTAGLRETADPVEAEGVRRALARAAEADAVLLVTDGGGGGAPCDLHIVNKLDLGVPVPQGALGISVHTGEGMAALRARLDAMARDLTSGADAAPLTNARQRAALRDAAAHLAAALAARLPELRGEDLRLALQALERLTGRHGVEAMLDIVFARFCIGK